MLDDKAQQAIQQSYQQLQQHLTGFTPRRAQNYLVAEIAKTLSGHYHAEHKIIIAEAGTGIGKSLAYLMSAIPVAHYQDKRIVISTATVALQEQLMNKDIPLYRQLTDIPFTYRVAKGRQRYCCTEKLAMLTEQGHDPQVALFESPPNAEDIALFKQLRQAYIAGEWDGDKDHWPKPIDEKLWQRIVSDKHSCQPKLAAHRHCPFQQARQQLEQVDLIIANHHLVMADADLGGGVILPPPEQTIYIFDEAHHLPVVARDHAAASVSPKAAASWLDTLRQSINKFAHLGDDHKVQPLKEKLALAISELIPTLNQLPHQWAELPFTEQHYRFEHGILPDDLTEKSQHLHRQSQKAWQALDGIHQSITEQVHEGHLAAHLAEQALAESGFFLQRLENLTQVWQLMAAPTPELGPPWARWLSLHPEQKADIHVHASPIEVGKTLDQALWKRSAGAVMVSATLRALNSFHYFCRQVGVGYYPEKSIQFLALASPFDFAKQGEIILPQMRHEPTASQFTDYIAEKMPAYIQSNSGNLVLYASYWQMNKVAETFKQYCQQHGWHLHIQGESSRSKILADHQALCEQGETSILFGTGSFSEGLDLPGKLLENLVITKIPFAVPTSPIEEAHTEYIEKQGKNPFMEISVPEASKKLIQSVGRLIRKENDSGKITILDRRLVTKRYGKPLLNALPPFTLTIQ